MLPPDSIESTDTRYSYLRERVACSLIHLYIVVIHTQPESNLPESDLPERDLPGSGETKVTAGQANRCLTQQPDLLLLQDIS